MSARLKTYLDENKVHYTLMSHSPAYTAQAAAATMHVPGKELAKSVVVTAGSQSALAVLPASFHVNLKKLGELLGKPTRLASEQEFISLFPDCELGAMPPFGQLYKLPVYVDRALEGDEEIVFNAGTHRDAIRMKYADFKRLASPQVADFATKG
ncbi:MAG: YbaK/EbsC family protein [Acidobacteria bacterium]|nr:YbaK/EbsC family protein [Acidobacteriota bacterium]MBI3485304.1 YbaK/EbsC family protein [Acidobacteriota bacterium]